MPDGVLSAAQSSHRQAVWYARELKDRERDRHVPVSIPQQF